MHTAPCGKIGEIVDFLRPRVPVGKRRKYSLYTRVLSNCSSGCLARHQNAMQCRLLRQARLPVTAGILSLAVMASSLRQVVGLSFARQAVGATCFRALGHPIFSTDRLDVCAWDRSRRWVEMTTGVACVLACCVLCAAAMLGCNW